MNIVNVPINLIKENPENPRNIGEKEFKKLIESIKKFPQMLSIRPIVVNNEMVVLGGNMRLRACKEVGLKEVPIIKAEDLTPEQQKEFIIKDNVGFGAWDWDKLGNDFDAAQLSEWGLEVLIEDKKEVEEDDFDVEGNVPVNPVVKFGDLITLNQHIVLCGDSLNKEIVLANFRLESADLYLTDPPYNVAYEGKTKEKLKIQNDQMDNASFREFLIEAFHIGSSILKAGASFYIWHADSEGYNFRGACFDVGLKVRQCLIWVKNSLVMGRQDYHWKHEPCLYGWKDGASHSWLTDRSQTTVIEIDRPSRNIEHPTMKPVQLFAYLISNSCVKGGVVFDNFLGSGTTLIACDQLDRICYGIELSPKYCDVIIKRYKKYCEDNNKEFICLINGVSLAHLF